MPLKGLGLVPFHVSSCCSIADLGPFCLSKAWGWSHFMLFLAVPLPFWDHFASQRLGFGPISCFFLLFHCRFGTILPLKGWFWSHFMLFLAVPLPFWDHFASHRLGVGPISCFFLLFHCRFGTILPLKGMGLVPFHAFSCCIIAEMGPKYRETYGLWSHFIFFIFSVTS